MHPVICTERYLKYTSSYCVWLWNWPVQIMPVSSHVSLKIITSIYLPCCLQRCTMGPTFSTNTHFGERYSVEVHCTCCGLPLHGGLSLQCVQKTLQLILSFPFFSFTTLFSMWFFLFYICLYLCMCVNCIDSQKHDGYILSTHIHCCKIALTNHLSFWSILPSILCKTCSHRNGWSS